MLGGSGFLHSEIPIRKHWSQVWESEIGISIEYRGLRSGRVGCWKFERLDGWKIAMLSGMVGW